MGSLAWTSLPGPIRWFAFENGVYRYESGFKTAAFVIRSGVLCRMGEIHAAQQFHLDQLKYILAEIDEHIKHLRQIEVYAVTGTFIVWGWLMSHPDIRRIRLAWLLPFCLVCFALLKHRSTQNAILGLGSYIRRAETEFACHDLGWENSTERQASAKSYSRFNQIFWSLLVAFSLGAGLALAISS